jgi:hypothetical protein
MSRYPKHGQINVEQEEVDELIGWCFEAFDEGTHYRGMTYEQGIKDTLDWLEGHGERPDLD